MVTLLDSGDKIEIGTGWTKQTFDCSQFYNAFDKAVFNSDDYDYSFRSCKQYRIEDSYKSIGIIPVPDYKRYSNLDSINHNNNYFVGFQVHDSRREKKVEEIVTDEKFFDIVSNSPDFYIDDLIEGDVVEYPEKWNLKNGTLFLNEVFEIDCDKMRENILDIIEGYMNGRKVSYKKLDEYSQGIKFREDINTLSCSFCGKKEYIIFLVNSTITRNHIPRSTVCFSCLPNFMSCYLGSDKDRINRLIVSPEL